MKNYVNHKKVAPTDRKTRFARFEQPIIAVKRVQADGDRKLYYRTFVSFQST